MSRYVYTCVHAQTREYGCVCLCVYVCVCAHAHTSVHVHTCMHARVSVQVHVLHICVCAHVLTLCIPVYKFVHITPHNTITHHKPTLTFSVHRLRARPASRRPNSWAWGSVASSTGVCAISTTSSMIDVNACDSSSLLSLTAASL